MDSLVAGQVALVAESSLAAVALVWLVAVYLKHVLFQSFVFSKFGVAFVTEERAVFCLREKSDVDLCSESAQIHFGGEKKSQTHHSWSLNILNEALTFPLIDGTWSGWDRLLSAAGTGSHRTSM